MIHGKSDGYIDNLVESFDIDNETPKLLYPKRLNRSSVTLDYRSQLPKSELTGNQGVLRLNISNTGFFRIRGWAIIEDEKDFLELVERVKEKAREEIDKRIKISKEWDTSYQDIGWESNE